MTGTPWEMKIQDGIVYRDKGGAVYGYNVMMSMVPDLRLGRWSVGSIYIIVLMTLMIFKNLSRARHFLEIQ